MPVPLQISVQRTKSRYSARFKRISGAKVTLRDAEKKSPLTVRYVCSSATMSMSPRNEDEDDDDSCESDECMSDMDVEGEDDGSETEPEVLDDDFLPRDYQIELLEVAKKQNTILFLPTGSGKTFVAVMLLKELMPEIEKPYLAGGKRSFFLVNTVPLVQQQASFIKRMLPLTVGEYSGDMNLDLWTMDVWEKELVDHQVLVMTAQILLDLLNHSYIHLGRINLIIFDECHRAVEEHPMRQIMRTFEHCNKDQHPRILGLTAALLNSNAKRTRVEQQVNNLEVTFHGTVATVSDYDKVMRFSANPEEKLITYKHIITHDIVIGAVKQMLVSLQQVVESASLECDTVKLPADHPVDTKLLNRTSKVNKLLRNTLSDVSVHLDMLGPFGGSKTVLAMMIQIIRWRKEAQDSGHEDVLGVILSVLTEIRSILNSYMKQNKEPDMIYKYSTAKVVKLLDIVKGFGRDFQACQERNKLKTRSKMRKKTIEQNPCCIVFVQRRLTAKSLYHVLKEAEKTDPEFKFLNSDFLVGFSCNPHSETREGFLEKKRCMKTVEGFNKGELNLLVATDVIEEGLDVPQCSVVIKFDEVTNYRSYVQSKGRARSHTGRFYFMVDSEEEKKFLAKLAEFRGIEFLLQRVLVGKTDYREEPTEDNIAEDLYSAMLPPYAPNGENGPMVTLNSAIALINRYCATLPQDRFTQLTAYWYIHKSELKAYLQLPTNCPLKDTIEGVVMPSKKQAKRAVALKACSLLHQLGQLNDRLLPVGTHSAVLDDSELFRCWVDEQVDNKDSRIGSRKRKRPYTRRIPEYLAESRAEEGQVAYLHVLKLETLYPPPPKSDTRKTTFYNMLNSREDFAILSKKPMTKVAPVLLYTSLGDLQARVIVNAKKLRPNLRQLEQLQVFHSVLFVKLLQVVKQFASFNLQDLGSSYFVVPVKCNKSGQYDVNWRVVEEHQQLPDILVPSDDERRALCVTEDTYLHSVVAPWYRGTLGTQPDQPVPYLPYGPQYYVVTRVCWDMNPCSPFPTDDHNSFVEYFQNKYKVQLMNPVQPLLEVKAISSKRHFLRPRKENPAASKRKRDDYHEDFEEHLVPELCAHFEFPAVLWVKATYLPSILYRITSLLVAEELRVQIAKDISLGLESLPEGMEWEPLKPDEACLAKDEECEDVGTIGTALPRTLANSLRTASDHKNSDPKDSWIDKIKPVDIDRQMEQLTLLELYDYVEFATTKLDTCPSKREKIVSPRYKRSYSERTDVPEYNCIKLLEQHTDILGPQQADILQTLTCASSNDVVNLERLETLGDSFLKLAATLFLFLEYKELDEGKLTRLKGKIIGNRNLFYCGRVKNLGEKITTQDFSPSADWIPPSFCVTEAIQVTLKEMEVSQSVLYDIHIPAEEQISGQFSTQTLEDIGEKILAAPKSREAVTILGGYSETHAVSDKTVADCVEALIGAYLKSCGIDGALRLLGWLEVLPPCKATPEYMFDHPGMTARFSEGDENKYLRGADLLEKTLGYKFRDRSFLLQALTHSSFTPNRITENYQRLEFLGDAILDFLITCYIYEHCGLLSPGQLTDLRSSLVNNVTFASLTVRNGFHKYLLSHTPRLMDVVNTFVIFQEERGHVINEEVLILLEEKEMSMAEAVEVPKVLGDLFESLAGAIFLDSGMSLEQVWRVYYHLMKDELYEFSRRVPKQPTRMLYEKYRHPKFHDPVKVDESNTIMLPLEVTINNEKRIFYGFGDNKAQAKRAAAKLALKAFPQQP